MTTWHSNIADQSHFHLLLCRGVPSKFITRLIHRHSLQMVILQFTLVLSLTTINYVQVLGIGKLNNYCNHRNGCIIIKWCCLFVCLFLQKKKVSMVIQSMTTSATGKVWWTQHNVSLASSAPPRARIARVFCSCCASSISQICSFGASRSGAAAPRRHGGSWWRPGRETQQHLPSASRARHGHGVPPRSRIEGEDRGVVAAH